MTSDVFVSQSFKREAKKLIKKFTTLKYSIDQLINKLAENPFLGTSYGGNIYKIRLADTSKGSGKSGGFRILYFHVHKADYKVTVLLITIYDKSEKSTITKADILKKLKLILIEESKAN